ncbi:MAG: hypothetical protein ABWZ78_16140 [Burkholderiaceae bacterium]
MSSFSRRAAAAALLVAVCVGSAVVGAVVGSSAVRAADKPAFDAARELADKITAQTKGASGAPKADSGDELPKVDPCSLLSAGEVRKFYPKAAAGVRERTREKYGIVACTWDHPAGTLVTQVTLGAKPGSAGEEARGIAFGFVDPLKPGAGKSIRYEAIAGVGDEAVAVVEKQDEKQGILSPAAYLYTQRGDRQLAIIAVDLARGDRVSALRTLQDIGKAAAARL